MDRPRPPRRRPEAPTFAPTSLTEIARRYYACAMALSKAMGVPMSETFMRQHRESVTACFIESGRAGVRLPSGVQLPPLAQANGQPAVRHQTNAGAPEADVPDFAPPTNGAVPGNEAAASFPTTIPTDAGLPCGGQRISDLKPASLSMVLNKVAALMHGAERDRWVPLLAALQSERAARLAKGRKVSAPEAHGDGA
jgi:hypothetical protein